MCIIQFCKMANNWILAIIVCTLYDSNAGLYTYVHLLHKDTISMVCCVICGRNGYKDCFTVLNYSDCYCF